MQSRRAKGGVTALELVAQLALRGKRWTRWSTLLRDFAGCDRAVLFRSLAALESCGLILKHRRQGVPERGHLGRPGSKWRASAEGWELVRSLRPYERFWWRLTRAEVSCFARPLKLIARLEHMRTHLLPDEPRRYRPLSYPFRDPLK